MDIDFKDYLNSSFIDIFLDCDTPQFNTALDTLYNDHFKGKGQRRTIRNQLRVLLMNFIECLKTSPDGFINYSRNNNYWHEKTLRIGNPWKVSAKLAEVCDILEQAQLVTQRIGSLEPNLQTRVRPLPSFISKYVTPHDLLDTPMSYHKDFPLVRIKIHNQYREKGKGAVVRKADSRKAKGIHNRIARYNKLLDKTTITLDKDDVTYTPYRKRMYRIFGDDKLTINGRFHGGFWQEIRSTMRPYILINGNRTVECDYKAQHPHMLYAVAQDAHMSEYSLYDKQDPYLIPKQDGNGTYPRGLVKDAFLCCMNAKSREAMYLALINSYKNIMKDEDKFIGKRKEAKAKYDLIRDRKGFKIFMEDLCNNHIPIAGHFYGSWWIKFFYFDSEVCDYVLDTMTRKGIPVLSVHDSFIVEEQHEHTLKDAMREAYKHINLPKALPPITTKRRDDSV